MKRCTIGVDVGLTSAKAAAFDEAGCQIDSVAAANPRVAVTRDRQEIDMQALWEVVAKNVRELVGRLDSQDIEVIGIGVTGHGNGLYLVDDNLYPVRPAIASTDSRAEYILADLNPIDVELVRTATGSVPWAGQPATLIRWLLDEEPEAIEKAKWALSCKDWITTCLTGKASADLSDASGCGLVTLSTRTPNPDALELLGVSGDYLSLLPELRRSDEVTGRVTRSAAALTGLPMGLPVVAGCMDCVASPLGAGSSQIGDVTVIVGTWAINAVVVPADTEPPRVTINALLPDSARMLAMEVAPTSAASVEWAGRLLGGGNSYTAKDVLALALKAPPLADRLLFLPFIHGAPDHLGASGTLLGLKDGHTAAHVARAVAEGVTQYHRAQLERVLETAASVDAGPWTLAGGGARNPHWAQMFADVIGHPIRRQLGTELGARGVASLAAQSAGTDIEAWRTEPDPSLVVAPGTNRTAYKQQATLFDKTLSAMTQVWETTS